MVLGRGNALGFLGPRTQDDDRRTGGAARARRLTDTFADEPRHFRIEDYDVGAFAVHDAQSLDAVVGGDESREFIRQSQLIADDWAKKGAVTRFEELAGANHYTVIDPLADPASAMTARVVKLAERVNAMALGG